MPIDFTKPVITDTHVNVLAQIRANDADLAIGLDPALTTPTSLINNAIRWSSAVNKWQKYNSTTTTWGDLSALYAINISGNAATATSAASATSATTLARGTNTTGIATTAFVADAISITVPRDSTVGSAALPVGTTAQRSANAVGLIRYNTDLAAFEGSNGTAWSSVGGGATGGGTDAIFYLNDLTINTNYTVPATKNAMTAGPVTIANGITVSVSTGATWTVV